MSDDNVSTPPASELYRRRVRFEWTVVCLIAVGAAAVVVVSWTPLPVDAVTLFFGLLAVAVLAGGAAVLGAFLFRTLPPSAHITRSADRDVTAAAKKVRRGKPVHPPQLQADAITFSRSGVRISLFTMSFQPVLAAFWALQPGLPGLAGFLNAAGPIVIALVLAALAWLGVLQHRLDTLGRCTAEARAGAPSVGAPSALGDIPGPPTRPGSL